MFTTLVTDPPAMVSLAVMLSVRVVTLLAALYVIPLSAALMLATVPVNTFVALAAAPPVVNVNPVTVLKVSVPPDTVSVIVSLPVAAPARSVSRSATLMRLPLAALKASVPVIFCRAERSCMPLMTGTSSVVATDSVFAPMFESMLPSLTLKLMVRFAVFGVSLEFV